MELSAYRRIHKLHRVRAEARDKFLTAEMGGGVTSITAEPKDKRVPAGVLSSLKSISR